MAKYLIRATYNSEGVKGVLKEGGSGRRKAVEEAIEALGGTMEAMYYAFGETDVFMIADMPDNVTAVAGSLITNASGTVKATYTPLITPEEVDEAAEKGRQLAATYRIPEE